jgi:hypothetical protein
MAESGDSASTERFFPFPRKCFVRFVVRDDFTRKLGSVSAALAVN